MFDPAACAVVGVVAIVNAVQVMGEFAAVSSAALDTPATDGQISGGLIANGLVGMLSGFLGGVPTATFGQNVGIIAENKGVNRMVFTLAAAILLIAGLLPKCAAVLTSIPQPVIGGATIGVFATIGMNGVGHTPSGMRGASSSRVLNSIMSIREILCAGRQNRSPVGVCTSMISEKQPYSTAMRSSE